MRIFILIVFWILVLGVCVSQTTEQATIATPTERQISADAWSKATKGVDYSKDIPKAKEKEREVTSQKKTGDLPDFSGIGKGMQVLMIVLGLLLIGYFLYRVSLQKFDKAIASDGVEITAENIENYLDEVNIDDFLRKAISEKMYNLAVRLYYLKTIKQLDTKGKVKWEKQKTNRDYLRETRNLSLAPLFKSLTNTYEQTWYGEKMISLQAFEEVESDFKLLISQI